MLTSSTGLTMLAVLGVPLALALAYWLFVENGPTPVIRAREGQEDGREFYIEDWVDTLAQAIERFLEQ